MLISRFCIAVVLSGFGAGAAAALDPNLSPAEAFRSGYEAYKAGDAETALEALEFRRGQRPSRRAVEARPHVPDRRPRRRGRQQGDGALRHASPTNMRDGNPHGPDAPFVADAFVTLGAYYQSGIPGQVTADPGRARRYFEYAASYFGDPDAQYSLASMFLLGEGGEQNARQAARWFKLAARKGHVGRAGGVRPHALRGIGVDRRPVEGLMWLSIARLSSPGDPLIQARHEQAFSTAGEEQRRQAMTLAEPG